MRIGGWFMTFGKRVSALRRELGISQSNLAKIVGVSPRTIFGYEAGTTYPRTTRVYEQLANALGVDMQYLIGADEIAISSIQGEIELSPAEQAKALTDQMTELLLSGMLTDDEKDDMLQTVQNAYWDSKRKH